VAGCGRKCIQEEHREYTELIVPESLRQRTAAMFFDDIWLFEQPWEFDVRNIRRDMQRSNHIWHGTGDKQVPSFLSTFALLSSLLISP
jgi:hypothetical protein